MTDKVSIEEQVAESFEAKFFAIPEQIDQYTAFLEELHNDRKVNWETTGVANGVLVTVGTWK